MTEIKKLYYYYITFEEILITCNELENLVLFVSFAKWSQDRFAVSLQSPAIQVISFCQETQKFMIQLFFVGQTDFDPRAPATYEPLMRENPTATLEILSGILKKLIELIIEDARQANSTFKELKTLEGTTPNYSIETFYLKDEFINFFFNKINNFNPF